MNKIAKCYFCKEVVYEDKDDVSPLRFCTVKYGLVCKNCCFVCMKDLIKHDAFDGCGEQKVW